MCHSDSDPSHDILVVDDNQRARQYISTLLSAIGHRITVATDGAQALSLMARTKFQLLITDLDMKPVDGFDLITLMGKLPSDRRVRKIIVCSARIGDADVECRPELRRAYRLVAKPIHPRELLSAVSEALPKPHTHHGFDLLEGMRRLGFGFGFSPR